MTCKFQDKCLDFAIGEMIEEEKEEFTNHLAQCQECSVTVAELEHTGHVLRQRPPQSIPESLTEQCIAALPDGRKKSIISIPKRAALFKTKSFRPAWQFAFVVSIFLTGLAVGSRLGRSGRTPSSQLSDLNRPVMEDNDSSRRLVHHYLVGVQMLFLDFSNIEDGVIDNEEWVAQIDITRETLQVTRQLKDRVRDEDTQLYRLVLEIELVLEEVVYSKGLELADLSQKIRETIDERFLLNKIRGYLS